MANAAAHAFAEIFSAPPPIRLTVTCEVCGYAQVLEALKAPGDTSSMTCHGCERVMVFRVS